ncbi:MAG: YiiG family protein [Beijerinckiaceae bacterium]
MAVRRDKRWGDGGEAMIGWKGLVFLLLCACAGSPAQAELSPQGQQQDPELQALIRKSNAYIGLMNRTLRAVESWNRYRSWVNPRSGPTGRERVIYGMYSLYDVREEIAKANEAASSPPSLPGVDASVKRYILAYNSFAPLVAEAEGYYERKDYLADKFAEGKELHAKLAPAAETFLQARADFEREMNAIKNDLDARELADIERREGRKARWHMRNVMVSAQKVVDLLPTGYSLVVDLPEFDAALDNFAAAVKVMDAYAAANPNSFGVFESQPRAYLGKLREFRQKIEGTKGDARRANTWNDLSWLVNDYNMMVSTSRNATAIAR